MPPDDHDGKDGPSTSSNAPRSTSLPTRAAAFFALPAPVKRLFDKTPLLTYPANPLPGRAPRDRDANTLHIFTTAADAAHNGPSFNPSCLKWQTYLNFHNIAHRTRPSNNHASPSGALPFLIPPASTSPTPIPSSKLETWIHKQSPPSHTEPSIHSNARDLRRAPYYSLLNQPIRLAYLHALYLHPAHFARHARALYIDPSSSVAAVRAALAYQLQAAALSEVLAGSSAAGAGKVSAWGGGGGAATMGVDVARLYADADEAFAALSELLGGARWFGGGGGGEGGAAEAPGLLDAAVFAYTHVILTLFRDEPRQGGEPGAWLWRFVAGRGNLVAHAERIVAEYYGAWRQANPSVAITGS